MKLSADDHVYTVRLKRRKINWPNFVLP